jgi:hypothetical protein
MTVRNPPVRRRPRRANSLKDIGRLLSGASTAHEISRVARIEVHSAKLNNTEGNARNDYFKKRAVPGGVGTRGVAPGTARRRRGAIRTAGKPSYRAVPLNASYQNACCLRQR